MSLPSDFGPDSGGRVKVIMNFSNINVYFYKWNTMHSNFNTFHSKK